MKIDALEMSQDALRLNRQGVLRDLAESTGGFLVAETNDLRPGLERVMADLREYHEVGYVPTNPKADGRWRAISVKVSRPGVVVRTRRGYYAMPPGAPVVLPHELALAEAIAARPMPRDVEHRAATLRFAGGDRETETLVWVEVPFADLRFARDETTFHGHISLLGQVEGREGKARRAAQPRRADRGAARRARQHARADHGGQADAPPPAGTVLSRDGGRGPGERARRCPADVVRDPRSGPGPDPRERGHGARRRGRRDCGDGRRPSPRRLPARHSAPRRCVSGGNARPVAPAQPLRRPGRPPARSGAGHPTRRPDGGPREAGAPRAATRMGA